MRSCNLQTKQSADALTNAQTSPNTVRPYGTDLALFGDWFAETNAAQDPRFLGLGHPYGDDLSFCSGTLTERRRSVRLYSI